MTQSQKISIPQEIKETNLDKLTPLQALNLLHDIKKKYEDEKRRKREATILIGEAKKSDKHNMLGEQIRLLKTQIKKI